MHEYHGTVDGRRFHWRECGGGAPIVLLHGLGVSGRYMLPTASLLAGTHRALVPDLPGFGRTPSLSRRTSIADLADVLARWMDLLGVEQAPFVANSFGCQVVVDLAARRPERVTGLVLVGPTVDRHARSLPRQLLRLGADAAVEPIGLLALAALDYSIFLARGGLPLIGELLRDQIESKLSSVEAPTLVVRGERDRIAPQAWVEEVASGLPRGDLRVVPRAPHAVNYAAPDALAELVRDFVAGLPRSIGFPDSR